MSIHVSIVLLFLLPPHLSSTSSKGGRVVPITYMYPVISVVYVSIVLLFPPPSPHLSSTSSSLVTSGGEECGLGRNRVTLYDSTLLPLSLDQLRKVGVQRCLLEVVL